jgi:hypothetical protein
MLTGKVNLAELRRRRSITYVTANFNVAGLKESPRVSVFHLTLPKIARLAIGALCLCG